MDFTTFYDEAFGYALSPALANYEFERIYGQTFGNNEFQAAITTNVPFGHSFKAFPFQIKNFNQEQITEILKNSLV